MFVFRGKAKEEGVREDVVEGEEIFERFVES